MDIDVEIELAAPLLSDRSPIPRNLPRGYRIEERGTLRRAAYLRSSMSETEGTPADLVIRTFLRELMPIVDVFRAAPSVLRIGIFYSLDETVMFPLKLSSACIADIAAFSLSLDASIYACGDDEDTELDGV